MILNKYVAGLERLRVNGFGSRQRCALEADAFKGKLESRDSKSQDTFRCIEEER